MKKIIFILLLILLLPTVSSLNTYKLNSTINLEHPVRIGGYPAPSASCNVTVLNPESIILVDFLAMTPSSSSHNFTLPPSNTSQIGTYDYFVTCSQGGFNETSSFQFEVTYTGRENPGTGFIVTYSLIFISIFVFLLYFFLHAIAKGGKFEYDIKDLSVSWGFLFGLLAMYLIFNLYWADESIKSLLLWVMGISIVTNGFIPIVVFIVSIVFGSVQRQSPYVMFGGKRR